MDHPVDHHHIHLW